MTQSMSYKRPDGKTVNAYLAELEASPSQGPAAHGGNGRG